MAQLVTFQYGDYVHEAGEVVDFQWREKANMTKRYYRETSLAEIVLHIQLLACDWGELQGKIDALTAAYGGLNNDQKFTILDENGAEISQYTLDPSSPQMMRGPWIDVIECPTGQMEELVVKREFKIVMSALFAAAESEIIWYEEQVRNIGSGPQWVTQPTVNAGVRSFIVWPDTPKIVIQEGYSIGFDGYYSPDLTKVGGGIPVLNISFEHLEERVDVPIKPQRIGPGFYYYPWKWKYVFEIPDPLAAGIGTVYPW